MKVLVAGATGALGDPLLRTLRESGHEVVGIARNEKGAEVVRNRGGMPVVADVMDRTALLRAVDDIHADAVLHELTALKKLPTKFADLKQTDQLRIQGSTNLLEAARAVGATRFLTQSIIFGYGYTDLGAVDENTPFGRLAGDATDGPIRALASAEQQAFEAAGIEGIALRYGLLYGADAATMAAMLNRRRMPIATRWNGTLGLIHHEDAASATVAALERGVGGRAYNIVDDTPVSWREYIETIARAHDTKPPVALPSWLLRIAAPYAGQLMTRINMQVSNQRARQELGWEPRYRNVAEGLEAPDSPERTDP